MPVTADVRDSITLHAASIEEEHVAQLESGERFAAVVPLRMKLPAGSVWNTTSDGSLTQSCRLLRKWSDYLPSHRKSVPTMGTSSPIGGALSM